MKTAIHINKNLTVITEDGNQGFVENKQLNEFEVVIQKLDSFVLRSAAIKQKKFDKYIGIAKKYFNVEITNQRNCGFEGKDSDCIAFTAHFKKI